MAPRRRAGRNPSGVNRRMLTQRQKLTAQRLPTFQGPSPAPQQGPSLRIPQGVMGTRQQPPVTTRPAPGPDIWNPGSYQGGRPPMPKGSGNPLQFLQSAFALLGGPASTAIMASAPTAVGEGSTMREAMLRGDYRPMQGPPAPKVTTTTTKKQQLSAGAKSFDRAFAAARAAGKSDFTWRGKRYNTRYAGE